MKYIKFFLVGILFGIVMSKGEIISWYRIYEMFKFQSFHMFGIIGSAVVLGIIVIQAIKKFKIKSTRKEEIQFSDKAKSVPRYLIGGIIFGLGWALSGVCPGPMFLLLGHAIWPILIVIGFSILGTLLYGLLREKLPH